MGRPYNKDRHLAKNKKRGEKLGMTFGKASGILRKSIMFHLVKKLRLDVCHHCKMQIEKIEEFTIEHIAAWENSNYPVGHFFDVENISFSHAACNMRAAFRLKKSRQQYREENKERRAAYMKQWWAAHPYKKRQSNTLPAPDGTASVLQTDIDSVRF